MRRMKHNRRRATERRPGAAERRRERIAQIHVMAFAMAGIFLIVFGLVTFGMTWRQAGPMIGENAAGVILYMLSMVWGGAAFGKIMTPDRCRLVLTVEKIAVCANCILILSAVLIMGALIYTTLMKRRQVRLNE